MPLIFITSQQGLSQTTLRWGFYRTMGYYVPQMHSAQGPFQETLLGRKNPSDSELIEQLKKLIKKLNEPKKEISAWLGVGISFLSTVVIAGLSLYFTNLQSKRVNDYNVKQIELQQESLKAEELKNLSPLIPSLASKDPLTREFTLMLLKSFAYPTSQVAMGMIDTSQVVQKSTLKAEKKNSGEGTVIKIFYNQVAIAFSTIRSPVDRANALGTIKKIYNLSTTPSFIKETAVNVATTLASNSSEPSAVREAASTILKNIKNVSVAQITTLIAAERINRPIDGIIIQDTGDPISAKQYDGLPGVLAIAKFQLNQYGWNTVSWHYLIAPDGSIWLGAPLNEKANNAGKFNATTVSIWLYLDGDKEFPTQKQEFAMKQVMSILLAKLHLNNDAVHTYHYLVNSKASPGKLITEEYIHKLIGKNN